MPVVNDKRETTIVRNSSNIVYWQLPTAITTVNSDPVTNGDNAYYNMMGQRFTNGNNLPAGIYIHNGKKVVIK